MKLGVNVDHVATVRQARRESFPDPVRLALQAVDGGADGITAHLREDRRHIQDADIERLKEKLPVPLNMEMAVSEDILSVAERVRPAWACLVPEKREELTTEGGLNVERFFDATKRAIERLKSVGTRVSLFIEPSEAAVRTSSTLGADAVELHTGRYAADWISKKHRAELERIGRAAKIGRDLGLIVNAGHGIDYDNVSELVREFPFNELNIGFSIVGRSLEVGMKNAVQEMKGKLN